MCLLLLVITYTIHALERMMPKGLSFDKLGNLASRGIPPSVVENAIRWGQRLPGNQPNTLKFVYDNVVVITNQAANVVITVRKGS